MLEGPHRTASTSLASGSRWRRRCDRQSARRLGAMWGMSSSTTSPAASGLGVAPRRHLWRQDRAGGAVATARAPDACDRCGARPPPLCRFPRPFRIRTRTVSMSLASGSRWRRYCERQSARRLRPMWGTASSPLPLPPPLPDSESHRVDVLGVGIALATPLRTPERQTPAIDVGHGLLPSAASPAPSGFGLAPCRCPWRRDRAGNAVATARAPDACDQCVARPPPGFRYPCPTLD
jgi:hypothetical protein